MAQQGTRSISGRQHNVAARILVFSANSAAAVQNEYTGFNIQIPSDIAIGRIINVSIEPATAAATHIAAAAADLAIWELRRGSPVLSRITSPITDAPTAAKTAIAGFAASIADPFNQNVRRGDLIAITIPPVDSDATPTAIHELRVQIFVIKYG